MPVLEAHQLMASRRIRHLPVTDGGRLMGIVTDRDIRLNLPSPATSLSVWEVNYLLARLTVESAMRRAVITVDPDRPVSEAARIMLDHKIGALPVVDGGVVVGIVTEIAVFYFSEYELLTKEGMAHDRAVVQAGINRFRPIAMTTIAAILALLPLALGLGQGSAMQQPLAIAIISGLIVQMPLVLLVMPLAFWLWSQQEAEESRAGEAHVLGAKLPAE